MVSLQGGKACRILDVLASEDGEEGDFLIARLFKFEEHWALSSVAARLPDELGLPLERLLRGAKVEDELLSHQAILGLFLPEGQGESEAAQLVSQANEHLARGQAQEALELLKRVLPLIVGQGQEHRILGQMATAYVMMGQRKEALAMLKAALKAEPGYQVALDNLGLLRAMSAKEFKERQRAVLFRQMNVVDKG